MGDALVRTDLETLEIMTRSGEVVVWARPIAHPVVIGGVVEVQADGVVRSRGGGRVEMACPEGTDVVIGSSSGRVECHGPLGKVTVSGHSGRVSIEEALVVEARSTSGPISVGACEGACHVVATTGSVRVGSAGAVWATLSAGRLEVGTTHDALIRSGSGRVDLGAVGGGTVDIYSQSGRVWVSLASGASPELHLSSDTGRVEVEIQSGSDGRLAIESSSGSIKVTRR